MNEVMEARAYETQVLSPEHHSELVRNIERVAKSACIPMQMIWTSMQPMCTEPVLDYVQNYRRQSMSGVYGLCFTGSMKNVTDTMMLIAGACIRNYIDARMMSVQDVLAEKKKKDYPSASILLIPNFFIGNKDGGHVPDWQVSELFGLILGRQNEGKQTVVYVQSMHELEAEYGIAFRYHMQQYFTVVPA